MEEKKLSLSTGTITVPVERDGKQVGTLCFSPEDPAFLNRFYELLPALEAQRAALAALPRDASHAAGTLAALNDACGALRGEIDAVFGAGTSAMVFGESCAPSLLEQFFEGIAALLRPVREEKLARYLAPEDILQ